ncbi:MAG: hypothetical protein K0R19_1091 [Bacillota bacterium]|nr:hypothetical protein [Bacillota bacterium]
MECSQIVEGNFSIGTFLDDFKNNAVKIVSQSEGINDSEAVFTADFFRFFLRNSVILRGAHGGLPFMKLDHQQFPLFFQDSFDLEKHS